MTKPRIEKLGALTLAELHGPDSSLTSADVEAGLRSGLSAAGLSLSVEPMALWLQLRLRAYELHLYAVKTRGQPAAAVEWLDQALTDVPRALHDGRLHQLPLRWVDPAVWLAAYRTGSTFESMRDGKDIAGITQALLEARRALSSEPSRRRASSIERDQLLYDVRAWLRGAGASAQQADDGAVEVLRAFGIDCPRESLPRALARAARAYRAIGKSEGQ